MCTVIYDRNLGFLSKNRDKTDPSIEEIVETDHAMGVRTAGTDYFSLAMNKNGVAFASTAINTNQWIQTAASGNKELAKQLFAQENAGRLSPTRFISQNLDNFTSAENLLGAIFTENQSMRAKSADQTLKGWMGYNVILADSRGLGMVIELYGFSMVAYPLLDIHAITNHFKYLKHGPSEFSDYPSTFLRLKACETYFARPQSTPTDTPYEALQLSQSSNEDESIWRSGAFFTISATDLWLKPRTLEQKTVLSGTNSDQKVKKILKTLN